MLLSKPATSSLSHLIRTLHPLLPTSMYPYPASFIPPLQSRFLLWKIIACTFSFLAKHVPELGISYLLGKCLTQITILFTFIKTWKISIRFFFFNCEKPTCKEETCMLAHNIGDLSSQPFGSQPMALGLCHIIWECVMEQREKEELRSHRLFKDIPQ